MFHLCDYVPGRRKRCRLCETGMPSQLQKGRHMGDLPQTRCAARIPAPRYHSLTRSPARKKTDSAAGLTLMYVSLRKRLGVPANNNVIHTATKRCSIRDHDTPCLPARRTPQMGHVPSRGVSRPVIRCNMPTKSDLAREHTGVRRPAVEAPVPQRPRYRTRSPPWECRLRISWFVNFASGKTCGNRAVFLCA